MYWHISVVLSCWWVVSRLMAYKIYMNTKLSCRCKDTRRASMTLCFTQLFTSARPSRRRRGAVDSALGGRDFPRKHVLVFRPSLWALRNNHSQKPSFFQLLNIENLYFLLLKIFFFDKNWSITNFIKTEKAVSKVQKKNAFDYNHMKIKAIFQE